MGYAISNGNMNRDKYNIHIVVSGPILQKAVEAEKRQQHPYLMSFGLRIKCFGS